ncbi:MAG: 1-acyl-sn-glycerol-3-phosphate acyltransferase [Pirellulaceae bacterium]|nr:1-acyl-sn-glycerol-3-phosphate acyltransferase [Pirellulaceae bacterium]
MQSIIIEKPYQFVLPHRGNWLPKWIQRLRIVDRYLHRIEGVESRDLRGIDHFRESLRQGHSVLLAPNHCRYADPMVMGWVAREVQLPFYAMASWHLFEQSRWMRWALRVMGAFSIYREGVDRQSLDMAVEILATGERPLVVFPEGAVFRTNDRLQPLLDGVAFLARTAAKKRAKEDPNKKVVIHPVAIKYVFRGDLAKSIEPVLATIEHRLTWSTPAQGDLLQRLQRAVLGILSLKEIEFFGQAQSGAVEERQQKLIDHLLDPLEAEWLGKQQDGSIIPRIKALRMKILPEMITGQVDATERDRRWKQLAHIYLAQQISAYPHDYLVRPTTPTRILETVERLEEDLTDRVRKHSPLHVIVEVGEAIDVPLERGPRGEEDPIMKTLRDALQGQLDRLSGESGEF